MELIYDWIPCAVLVRSRVNPHLVSSISADACEPFWLRRKHRSFRPAISLTTLRQRERSYTFSSEQ